MKQRIFTGAATALITPMFKDGSIDFEGYRQNIEYQIQNGIDAIVSCATTGECSTINYADHLDIVKAAIEYADHRVPVIASTGSNDTDHCVRLSKDAVKAGADGLLSVTPYYNKTSQHGLVAHFSHIASHVDAPIILYNVPSRTGLNIEPQTYKELSKIDNIVATKEASGNLENLRKTMELCGDDLTVYSGNDDQMFEVTKMGGKGVISVFSNILPGVAHDIIDLTIKGEIDRAKEISDKYMPLMKALFYDINPVPCKEAMNMIGMPAGYLRLPLVPMLEETREQLKKVLQSYDLI